jgi:hypothetical protein
MTTPTSGRPQEGLRGGASGVRDTEAAGDPTEQINAAIRERVWYPAPKVVNLEEVQPPYGLPRVYLPEDHQGLRGGASALAPPPTEGETHRAINDALRSAAKLLTGR